MFFVLKLNLFVGDSPYHSVIFLKISTLLKQVPNQLAGLLRLF